MFERYVCWRDKSDCPIQIFILMILNRLLVYLTSFTVCSGDIKKKALKKTSQREFRILKKLSTQLPIRSNKVFLFTQVHSSNAKAANSMALHIYIHCTCN